MHSVPQPVPLEPGTAPQRDSLFFSSGPYSESLFLLGLLFVVIGSPLRF